MRLPRSPYKRAESAIDSWDYESEEGQEKARTAAVFTIPVALVLLVVVIVAIAMHLAGAFDPERDAYREAQSHVEDITRRSERGLDKTRTDKPANGDTTDWTLFPSLPDGAAWNTSNVAYHDTCLSQRKQVQDALTSRYQYLKTGIYPVAYAPTLTDTPTDCPARLDGYVFLSDGATPVLYVAHMNAGTPDADNVTNMVTANASMATWEALFRSLDADNHLQVRNLPDGWDMTALVYPWNQTPTTPVASMFDLATLGATPTLYVAGYRTPSHPDDNYQAAWAAATASGPGPNHTPPPVVVLDATRAKPLLNGQTSWFTTLHK